MAHRVVMTLLLIAGLACGDARRVRMTVGEKIEIFDLSVVAKIEFVAPLTGTAAPSPAAAAGTLNGIAAPIAIVAASPNGEKAPELPSNPFTSLPGGASKTPEPKPPQPNQPCFNVRCSR